MTRLEIRDLIRKRLGETTTSFWSDTELNTWINDACTDLSFRTKCLKSDSYMTSIYNQGEYTLSNEFPNIITFDEVYFHQNSEADSTASAVWMKMVPTSRTEMDKLQAGWKSVSGGIPSKYYWDREDNLFGFYPIPDTNNAITNGCHAYYRIYHTDLNDDTQSPSLPEYLQPAAVDFVVATGYETRGWGDKANDAWNKYITKIHDYQVERHREREDDDLVAKNYRNL